MAVRNMKVKIISVLHVLMINKAVLVNIKLLIRVHVSNCHINVLNWTLSLQYHVHNVRKITPYTKHQPQRTAAYYYFQTANYTITQADVQNVL